MLAQRLDMLGINVFAACFTDAAQSRLRSVTSSRLRTLKLDVTSNESVSQAVDYVMAHLPENQGKADILSRAKGAGSPVNRQSAGQRRDTDRKSLT